MKVKALAWLDETEKFISRKDIKVKYITTNDRAHYVFYKEKLLSKIIKTILHKK